MSKQNIISYFKTTSDQKAWNTCKDIAENNEVVFARRPVYEKKFLSLFLGKNYIKSDVLCDITDRFYFDNDLYPKNRGIKKLNDFPTELYLGSQKTARPSRQDVDNVLIGYCIRTGDRIPFNPKRPFSENAYRIWIQFGNIDYQENFCHMTGRHSHGKTSMRHPIL